MANISIHFFGKPEWEFEEKVNAADVKAKGDELKERLYKIANAMDKLETRGWESNMALYDIYFSKDISRKEAEKELKQLDIDKGLYHLDEFDEEDEEG
mgnify:CR=1 FL=1